MLLMKCYVIAAAYFSFLILYANSQADSKNKAPNSPFKIYLGSLFAIYARGEHQSCNHEVMYESSVMSLENVLFTLKKVNENQNFLPGIELVLKTKEDCVVDSRALSLILENYLGNHCSDSNERVLGVIGSDSSDVSIPVAKLLGILKIPQISSGATSAVLSDKTRFPYFFRTVSSDADAISGILKLLLKNKWHYVSFVHDEDEYGMAAYNAFKEAVQNSPICVAQLHKLPRNLTELEAVAPKVIKSLSREISEVHPVIVFSRENHLVSLFKEVLLLNSTTRFQWIGADSWFNIKGDKGYSDHGVFLDELREVIKDTIMFVPYSSSNKEFDAYISNKTLGEAKQTNPFYAEYLAKTHNCSLEQDSMNRCPDNITASMSKKPYPWLESNADCILAFAHALDSARKQLCKSSTDTVCEEFRNLNRTTLYRYLRKVSFRNGNDMDFRFDENQDGPTLYNVLMFRSTKWEAIGNYTGLLNIDKKAEKFMQEKKISQYCREPCESDKYMRKKETKELYINEDKICFWKCKSCKKNEVLPLEYRISMMEFNLSAAVYDHKQSPCLKCNKSQHPDNFTCAKLPQTYFSFAEPFAWGLSVVSALGLVLTTLFGYLYFHHWNTPIIRASGRELSLFILFGVFLLFTTPFLFCMKPSVSICAARNVILGAGFSFVFSGLLIKTARIAVVFNFLGKRMIKEYKLFLRPTPQLLFAFFLSFVEVFVLMLMFLNKAPSTLEIDSSMKRNKTQRTSLLICEGINFTDLIFPLTYPALLILISAVFAFKIRKVPTGYNEAKFIGFAVYTTLVIWLAQLSTYFVQSNSSRIRNNAIREPVYCLFLLFNALIILLSLFGPKIYIVLFRPNKNNESTVMSTTSSAHSSIVVENLYSCTNSDNKKSAVKLKRSQSTTLTRKNVVHCQCCTNHESSKPVSRFTKTKLLTLADKT